VDGTNGCIKAFKKLQKAKYPTLKLILSIGGEADSRTFNEITSNMIHLERFVHTARRLVDELGMNGIDIDWEFPSNEAEGRRYTHLLARLRAALPSPKYIVTTAVPAGIWALRSMNLGEAADYVDLINLMAYDFVGPFPDITVSGHHSQLRCPPGAQDAAKTSGEAAMQFLLKHGVAREKIVLGVPLYGRSFLGASGPAQAFSGHGGDEDGTFEYRYLPVTDRHPSASSNGSDVDAITPCAEQFDSALAAAWCVGPQTKEGGGFITYDNAMSVEAKARFVKDEGLGGLFYWHIGFDKSRNEGSLVDVGGGVLGVGQKRSSWRSYYR
jgi:chitinase